MTTLPDGWKPISSAPKDGSLILLGCPDEGPDGRPELSLPGYWIKGWCDAPDDMGQDDGWVDVQHTDFYPGRSFGNPDYMRKGSQPTHWMPLPAAPCQTCNDQGAVGNILTAEPCPECTPRASAQDDAKDEDIQFSKRRILGAALWWAEQREIGPIPAKSAWEAFEKHTLMQLRSHASETGDGETIARHIARTLADAIYATAKSMGISNGDETALSMGQCLDLLERMPAPAAGDARVPSINIEAAAKAMAECMDYPWAHMPEQGRATMREHAQTVIRAASQQQEG